MKDQAISIVKSTRDPREAKNELREYLQHLILRKMFELNINRNLVFHGGTALRIIHGLERFSEDLDFHAVHANSKFDFSSVIQKINTELQLNGYSTNIRLKTNTPVKGAFIKFANLLYEANLSLLPKENITIKLEIDTNPPTGYSIDKYFVNKYFPFSVIHHDKESFLSGKCAAIIQRQYTKGRDFYDLLFYLSRWKNIKPNFPYLNNCLIQIGYSGDLFSANNWKRLLLRRLKNIDWKLVKDDVQPFIGSLTDIQLLEFDTFDNLLKE
ncbi:MAG: nucleotidyl transferase AbiEii/AbiGii toxin family protein [Candidatus Marinimicrobia bacterium]|nr:nucleotidyl transferase AbiEii/AbiGii toxin family protein [Candidatus Neomarinimicrobiota bacterium]